MDEKDRHIVTFEDDEPVTETNNSVTNENNFSYTTEIPNADKPAAEEIAGDSFVMRPSEPEPVPAEPHVIKVEPEEIKTEPVTVKAETDEIKAEPVTVKAEADEINAEPVTIKAEADEINAEPVTIKAEADEVKAEPVAIKTEAEEIKTEPVAVKAEAEEIKTESAAVKAEADEIKAEPEEIKAETEIKPAEPVYTARRMAHEGPAHVKAMPKKEKKYVTKGALAACMILTMILSTFLGALLGGALSGKSTNDGRAPRNDSELTELDLSEATGSKLTVGEVISKNADAVVEIVVEGTSQGMWGQLQLTQGAGSGVIVKEDGYIATNYHVVQGANKVQVTLHNGDVYSATIVGTDQENDIAVIKIDAQGLTTATIGDSSKVEVGDLAVAIGNPLGQLGGTATSGIISALDRTLTIEGTTLTLLQTDAAINGGNSGGGLFNGNGELIGIVESKASAVGVEGLAFALPINSVSGIINDMIENGGSPDGASSSTPAVGVVISEISEDNAQYYGLDSAGVYIAQVTGSNALKAGFQERDKVLSIDGKEVTSSSEFISIIRSHKVGDTVTIVVSREGQEIEIVTELEALSNTQG